jgi:hypothetical protein
MDPESILPCSKSPRLVTIIKQITRFYYIKQYSNRYGHTEYPYGVPLATPILKYFNAFKIWCLRALVDAPWYVPNRVLHKDLGIQTVREEVML